MARTSPGRLAQGLEGFLGTRERLQPELGLSDEAQPFRFPFEPLRFLGQQPQVATFTPVLGQLDVFLEIERYRDQYRAVVRLEIRKQLKNRAVPVFGVDVEGRAKRSDEGFDVPRKVRVVVREVAVGLEVERIFGLGRLRPQQERMLVAQRVANPKLVKSVRIVDRDIGHDEIRRDQQAKHVLANVSLPDEAVLLPAMVVVVLHVGGRARDQRPFRHLAESPFSRAKRSDEKARIRILPPAGIAALSIPGSPANWRHHNPGCR